MKDEHLARIEALKLTQMIGGLSNQDARIEIASKFERYILNGYSGEAKPAAQAAEMVPVTEEKEPPKRGAKGRSKAPVQSGEASDLETEGETDPSELGRPSSRVIGVAV
jgi:hypothetical protein